MKRLLILLLTVIMLTGSASAAWWNSSWGYVVHNNIANGTRPYQISVNISNSAGTNDASHIYCDGHCNSDFSDIRFTLANTTTLNYWRNNRTNEFTVNVTGNGVVNMYYGNPTATNVSNGYATFPWFEDFGKDLSAFSVYETSASNVEIVGGRLQIDGETDWNLNGVISNYNMSRPFILEWENYANNTAGYYSIGYNKKPLSAATGVILSSNLGAYSTTKNDSQVSISTSSSTSASSPDVIRYYYNNTNGYSLYVNGVHKNSSWSWIDKFNFYAQAHPIGGINLYIDNIRVMNYSVDTPYWTAWTTYGSSQSNIKINASKDAWVNQVSATTNYGTDTALFIDYRSGSSLGKKIFVGFNTSSLPANVTITDATLYIYSDIYVQSAGDGIDIAMYNVTSSWAEDTVTWNVQPSNATTAFNTIYNAELNRPKWNGVDITNTMKGWYGSTLSNNGILLDQLDTADADGYNLALRPRENATYYPYISVNYTTGGAGGGVTLISPTNTSTTASTTVTLTWVDYGADYPDTYQVATDSEFLNVVASGTGTSTAIVGLSYNTQYYWHVKSNTGSYTDWWTFTTPSSGAGQQGCLDIRMVDEQTYTALPNFTVQLYNSTRMFTKSTTTGWVNFSNSEISSGEFLVRAVPNSSYASRSVLATSPSNVTIYVPSTANNTIDTIAFYLLDYTGKFSWTTSHIAISKNSSTIHSSYFDADAKVTSYLIRGDSYTITVYNGDNIQQWGNYITSGSTNVQIVVMNIGVNATKYQPFVYYLNHSTSDITLQWVDNGSIMTSINFTIYKGTGKSVVHSLTTSVNTGSSVYIVTNTSDIYYVYVSALTTKGWRNESQVIDYRGSGQTEGESARLHTWNYGTATIPGWVQNAFAIFALMILAGTFGALHRGEGGIIVSAAALFFWKFGWLTTYGAGVGFLGGLMVFAVLYHLETKRRGTGYY